jgi:ribosomal protein L16
MLQPKRTKYRKQQKGRVTGVATRGHRIAFGSFAIKSLEGGWITARQIEAARIAMTRAIQTNQLLKNLQRFVWVKVKVLLNIGLLVSNQVQSYSNQAVFQ